jgi:DNA modification methylase
MNEEKTMESGLQKQGPDDQASAAQTPGGGQDSLNPTNQTLELVSINRLTSYRNNARMHSRKQIREIAKSIERFGFVNPVLIDDDGQVIAGHGRVAAAKLLELAAVPCVRVSHLSETEKRAYILADNRLAEKAGWDREILAIELQALIDLDFEVELTGFQVGDIDLALEDADEAKHEAAGPEDDLPDLLTGPSVSRPGDLWILGPHLLLCGDALDPSAYKELLDSDKAEFVLTDPPFNVRIDGNVCGKGAIHHREFAMASGEMSPEAFVSFLSTVFRNLAANTADGSIHQVFMDWRHVSEMMAAGKEAYSELKNLCIWAKTNAGMGSFYRSQHELVFVWKKGTAPHVNNFELGQHGRHRSNVWSYPGVSTMRPGRLEELAMHPTVKPVALVADAIKDCSRRGGLVLDPFCGSGTVLIAAERTGRKARALEIDPAYVDLAVRRWQSFTGKVARLGATGQTFEEVAETRVGPERQATDGRQSSRPALGEKPDA